MYLFLVALGLCCCSWAFSSCGNEGLLSSCGAWVSLWGGISCCRAQALECLGSSICTSWALEHGLSSCGAPRHVGSTGPGIKFMSAARACRLSTTGPAWSPQMSLFTQENQTHRRGEQTYGCREGWGEGMVRESEINMYTLLYSNWITRSVYCIAQGTLLNVLWQPAWERSLEENGCMYIYCWDTQLCIWNCHNIVNWLYSNIK